jgi:4-hydroxy-tetrahydrodipicolinate reductase
MSDARTRVAIAGVLGRMGSVARNAVCSADDMEYVGGLARIIPSEVEGPPRVPLYDNVNTLVDEAKPDVLLDWSICPASVEISMTALRRGVRPVIGASGWSDFDRRALEREAAELGVGAMLVPNFALGMALAMRFAEEAAKLFPTVEIVEFHHDAKKDRPSGTALATAARIAASGGFGEVPIHSVRLRGLVAHQETLFGGEGEVLTIRHDCLSREAYVAGTLAAIRHVMTLRALTIGLDPVLSVTEAPPSTSP